MKEENIIEKLNKLENGGNIKDVPFVLDNLFHKNKDISNKCEKLLTDIKIKDANILYIERYKNTNNAEEIKKLLSIFWQSGLDFGNYISLFFDAIIKYDIETALEAMSVVENSMHNNKIDSNELKLGVKKLKDYILNNKDDIKTKMIKEFLLIFDN